MCLMPIVSNVIFSSLLYGHTGKQLRSDDHHTKKRGTGSTNQSCKLLSTPTSSQRAEFQCSDTVCALLEICVWLQYNFFISVSVLSSGWCYWTLTDQSSGLVRLCKIVWFFYFTAIFQIILLSFFSSLSAAELKMSSNNIVRQKTTRAMRQ